MRTFSQKTKTTQLTSSTKSSTLSRAHDPNSILKLQRTMGNQALLRLLQSNSKERNAVLTGTALPHFGHDFARIPISPPKAGALQTKLPINKPGDEYEQEADSVAEQVMRIPETQLQHACSCSGECPKCQKQRARQGYAGLQTKPIRASGVGLTAPPVSEVSRSTGQSLDVATRSFMEPRFAHDFSSVRIHSDSRAAQAARSVKAMAHTVGSDVVFGAGHYQPETNIGRRLLAHELTHVIQQSAAAPRIQRHSPEGGESPELVLPPEFAADAPLPRTFTFWINAFIPGYLEGAIPVPAGPEKGKTMFPGPFPGSDCFLTDSRGFSSNRLASARVHVEGVVDLHTRSLRGSALYSSGTKELDCEDGEIECAERAAVSGSVTTQGEGNNPNLLYIKINDVAASDPCVTGAPNVNMNGTINLDLHPNLLNRTFFIEMYIEPFPDFEMYAHVDDGPPRTLFRHLRTETSPFSLIGGATSRVRSTRPFSLSLL
jgi:Domain of unknown function (DUF4157)